MDGVTFVFTEAGTVAHLLDPLLSPNDRVAQAMCGRTPWPGYWHGTGDQEEIERATSLEVCSSCESVRRHRQNGFVTR